jgi:hypothetical protein
MRWRWWRRTPVINGEAIDAKAAADAQLEAARRLGARVDRTARNAAELARRSGRFARDVEQSLHLRGHG